MTSHRLDARRTRQAATAAAVGNIVEWYDWSVYAIFAFYFSAQFFPSDDPTGSVIASWCSNL